MRPALTGGPKIKSMRIRNQLILLFALLLPVLGHAQAAASAPHLSVQLIVPPAQIYPNQNFTAGLYFKLEPGWHVYWINAGDSGEPPSIHWPPPAGITAYALQFPAPNRLPLGPLMDFGYENEVLFPFTVDVAKTAKLGPAVLHAKVDWLVCREVCIPGKAELEENVQIVAGSPSAMNQADQALLN